MRRVIIALILIWSSLAVSAAAQDSQSLQRLLTSQLRDPCGEYQHNAKLLVPRLYHEDKRDSVWLILNFLSERCATSHHRRTVRVLTIDEGRFHDSLCDSTVIQDLLRSGYQRDFSLVSWESLGLSPVIDLRYGQFLDSVARADMARYDTTQVEYVLSALYAGEKETAIRLLRGPALEGTRLRKAYDTYVARAYERFPNPDFHVAAFTGIWMPQGDNRLLGNKLELGFMIGDQTAGAFRWDIDIALRFLNAKQPWTVVDDNTVRTSEQFNGAGATLDLGRRFLRIGRHDVDFFAGVGYDGVGQWATENDEPGPSANALSFSFGTRYRYFVDKVQARYVGLAARVHLPDYHNTGGSDISGAVVSVQFLYGVFPNSGLNGVLHGLRAYP